MRFFNAHVSIIHKQKRCVNYNKGYVCEAIRAMGEDHQKVYWSGLSIFIESKERGFRAQKENRRVQEVATVSISCNPRGVVFLLPPPYKRQVGDRSRYPAIQGWYVPLFEPCSDVLGVQQS